MDHQRSSSTDSGIFSGVTGLGKNLLGLLVNRIELAALEMNEVRTQIIKILLLSALGVIATWFAVAYWSILLVILAWDSWGWKIIFLVAALFSAMAFVLLQMARGMLQQGKLSLTATMTELRKDRDALL